VLRELLLESRLGFAGGTNQYVDPELEEVRRELASIDYRIRQLSVDGSVISLAALGAARDDLDRKRKRLEERARLRNPRLAAVSAGEPARLSDIRSGLHLDSKTVLLTYSLGDSASYLWVVRSDSTTLHRLPPSDFLATAVARCRDRIVGFGMRNTSVSGGDTDALAKDRGVGRLGPAASEADERLDPSTNLYDLLVKPAAHAIDTAERAIIVPDGALHLLPFEALVREEPSAPSAPPRYAFENVEVHYGPSATTLVYLAKARDERRRSHNSMDLLAVGDPDLGTSGREADVRASHLERLPFTREEVLAAREFFPGDRNTVLLGPEAQERTLREIALEQYRILHLATHGIFDEEDPDRSGLVMSFPSDSTHDGYLEAWEIGKLELNAELVVLSACETGLGRLVRGEGLLSLPRAFFYAGANAVIVSLWKVPDESTSLFMKAFYRALVQEKTTPAKALSLARKSLRADPRFEHPFYWAAFVLLAPPSS
jgi:CHAT domain-containing protein